MAMSGSGCAVSARQVDLPALAAQHGIKCGEHHERSAELTFVQHMLDQDTEGVIGRFFQGLFDVLLGLESFEDGRLHARVQTILNGAQQRVLPRESCIEGSDRRAGALQDSVDREEIKLLLPELVLCRRQQVLQRLVSRPAARWAICRFR
jgi:hypothetical protein